MRLSWSAVSLEWIEKNRESVAEQLKENGVAVLPVGVRAVVVRRDNLVVKGERYEPIH